MLLHPGTQRWLSLTNVDATPRALDSELPLVHGYIIKAADSREREGLE